MKYKNMLRKSNTTDLSVRVIGMTPGAAKVTFNA